MHRQCFHMVALSSTRRNIACYILYCESKHGGRQDPCILHTRQQSTTTLINTQQQSNTQQTQHLTTVGNNQKHSMTLDDNNNQLLLCLVSMSVVLPTYMRFLSSHAHQPCKWYSFPPPLYFDSFSKGTYSNILWILWHLLLTDAVSDH